MDIKDTATTRALKTALWQRAHEFLERTFFRMQSSDPCVTELRDILVLTWEGGARRTLDQDAAIEKALTDFQTARANAEPMTVIVPKNQVQA